jgi:hypothetical protein
MEKITPTIEPHYQLPTNEPLPLLLTTNNASGSSKVNIDQFRERTFEKSTEVKRQPTMKFFFKKRLFCLIESSQTRRTCRGYLEKNNPNYRTSLSVTNH